LAENLPQPKLQSRSRRRRRRRKKGKGQAAGKPAQAQNGVQAVEEPASEPEPAAS
jgi:hypothetical protein